MQQHRASGSEGLCHDVSGIAPAGWGRADVARELTRRQALAGGSLTLAAMLMAGCNGARQSSRLPQPIWSPPPSEGPQTVTAPPASAPTPVPGYGSQQQPPFAPDPPPVSGVIPRSAWTRYSISNSVEHFPLNGVRRITVHHDGMPPVSLSTQRQVASRIEQIRQSHVMGRGWADLGYHYVIDPSGRIWEGRNVRWQGAHVKDQNENNLGVLVMGNFDRQSPTSAALNALDGFLALQMQQYRVALGGVRTHMERASTACPGRNLQAYMIRTRSGGGVLNAMAGRAGLNRA